MLLFLFRQTVSWRNAAEPGGPFAEVERIAGVVAAPFGFAGRRGCGVGSRGGGLFSRRRADLSGGGDVGRFFGFEAAAEHFDCLYRSGAGRHF